MAIKPIEILINAKDNASSVFSSLQAKVAAVGAAIAGYFGIKSFVGIVEGAANFEQAMSRVQAATGASAAEMASLKQAAQDAGANTKYTSTEAAGALETLAKAGLSAKDAVATLPAVLNLAQAGDIALADASEIVTKAVMGMGLKFADAARVADVLALGANATNTSVTGLAEALSYAAPIAQSAGVSLEGTVAIMGKLADAGIDASRSGTAVAAMLAQFADPTSTFKRALAEAGITTNNFEQALHQLAAAGPKGEKAILAVGLNAGPALRALLNQGMGALDDLKGKLEGAAGSAAATAKVMQDNLAGSFKGLTSAWDTVKNVLGTPVLPVLKDGVDQLAAAFRSAVADGTVQRFGESIATAFSAGIKWVREFIGTVDFTALGQRLQAFADSAQQQFDRLGQYATNAGATVQVAVGVVQTSFATLMVTAGGVANAIVLMVQAGLKGLELLYRASSKITFGDISAQYKAMADDFAVQSAAMGAASDAVAAQIRASLDGIGAGMTNVQEGFGGIKTAISGASSAATEGQGAQAALNRELQAGAEAAAAAGVAYQQKAQKDIESKQASEEHRAAIAQLRDEYAALIASGDLQGAAEKLGEINAKLRETPDAGKAAADAMKAVQAAFQVLGVTSAESLNNTAKEAKAAYETIRDAGTSTAEDIALAFKSAADKAIAANKGVAPSWVEAQAATRGYRIETDAAGKSTLVLADAVDKSAGSMRAASGAASAHATAVRDMGDAYTDAAAKALAAKGQFLAAAAAQKSADTSASSITNRPKSENQFVWTRAAIIDYLKQSGLNELLAERLAKQFSNPDGSVNYEASAAQKKWGGQYGTLAEALGKMSDYYQHDTSGKHEAQQMLDYERTNAGLDKTGTSRTSSTSSTSSTATTSSAAPGKSSGSGVSTGNTYVSHVNITGVSAATLNFADPTSQANAETLFRQLAQAKGASS